MQETLNVHHRLKTHFQPEIHWFHRYHEWYQQLSEKSKSDKLQDMRSTLSKEGTSFTEVPIRIAMGTAAIAILVKQFTSSSISLFTKYRLYKSAVFSILQLSCEALTLKTDI
ncbi:hypothetical protein DPMN_149284 [Dreissena polymorpha]|uniref:Uncharacterized protein n=1 Tax=Dreissena polymorpha TaxID=45954 RepID=A0A9D4J2A7_DREPO|nr:hypothetical protein DPMN_149284 [Dreissena polymorpha]